VRFGAGDAVRGKNGEMLKEVAKSNENADLWSKSDFVGKLSEIEN